MYLEILQGNWSFSAKNPICNLSSLAELKRICCDPSHEYIYFLYFGQLEYKIGRTNNPLDRFPSLVAELNAGFEVKYLIKTSESARLEKSIHAITKDCTVFRKEYFRLSKSQIDFIIEIIRKEGVTEMDKNGISKIATSNRMPRVAIRKDALKIAEFEAALRDKPVWETVCELIIEASSEESKRMYAKYIARKQ